MKTTYYQIKWRFTLTGETGVLDTVRYDDAKEALTCAKYFNEQYPSRRYTIVKMTADTKRGQT